MGFSLRRWLLATLSRRELAVSQLDWKFLRFTYSQFGEDIIVGHLLPEPSGFYVDVGACQPVQLSNTYAFYRRGWHGLVIDGDPDFVRRFQRWRPRDKVVQAVVSNAEEDTAFRLFESEATNRLIKYGPIIPDGPQRETISVRTTTLKKLLADHLPSGCVIDFMNVDCEGADLDVLRGNDWERVSPRVIAVEDFIRVDQSPICAFLRPLGYDLVATSGLTRIFQLIHKT